MEIFDPAWKEVATAFIESVATGALGAGIQNHLTRQDWRQCAKFGTIAGLGCGVVCAFAAFVKVLL